MTNVLLKRLIIVINLLLITAVNNAQTPFTDVVEDVLETIAVNNYEDEEIDWSNVIIDLYEQIDNPINVNSATKQELERFPFLSHIQIENLLAYIYLHGEMKTLSELMLVKDMDRQTID